MNSNTTIKKIKIIESTGKIEIDCIRRGEQGEDEVKGLFAEQAAPEFYEAMKALTVPGANILEAPELAARLVPFAVTYHYDKDDTMGAIITMKLKLPESKAETVINTPMRKCAKSDNPQRRCTHGNGCTRPLEPRSRGAQVPHRQARPEEPLRRGRRAKGRAGSRPTGCLIMAAQEKGVGTRGRAQDDGQVCD